MIGLGSGTTFSAPTTSPATSSVKSANVVVVARDRVAELDLDARPRAVRLGDPLGDAAQVVVHLDAGRSLTVRIVPTISAVSGMMLFVVPADDLTDRHDRGVEDVDRRA